MTLYIRSGIWTRINFCWVFYSNIIPQNMIDWFKEKFGDNKENEPVDEDNLKKTGFDPTKVPTTTILQEPFCDFSKDLIGFLEITPEEVRKIINDFKFYPAQDDHRHELSYKSGGKICGDKMQIEKVRGIGKEMIMEIGRKLITGDLNLTKVSFPIKAMVPRTSLQTATYSSCTFPFFMGLACRQKDPLQKLKYVITGVVSPNYYMDMFLKPFNPILGQTLQGHYSDGTKLYCQQISHHPPISYFLVVGPNEQYRYYGYYDFEAKAGLNSGKLINRGKRWIEFKSGEKFEISFLNVEYEGVFLGTLRESTIGTLDIKEPKHKLHFRTKFGKVSKKPDDYFQGVIKRNDKDTAKVYGTYLGFVEIEGRRYWDGRRVKPFRFKNEKNPLPSDSSLRKDIEFLEKGRMAEAQFHRDELENTQRKDTKLRKATASQSSKKK